MLLPTALLNPPQTPSAAPIMPESATKIERINLKTKCWCKKISRPAIAKRLIIILFLTDVIARRTILPPCHCEERSDVAIPNPNFNLPQGWLLIAPARHNSNKFDSALAYSQF